MSSKPSTDDSFIPLSIPEIRGNEQAYIASCLTEGWVSSVGPFVDQFEQQFADYIGSQHAVAMSSGTAALHIGLLLCDIRPDDEVLVSTLTFIASANAICYTGAKPIFIDAEPDHWQMDPQKLSDFLKNECTYHNGDLHNRTTNKRIGAIMPVHILGHPCDLNPIRELAQKYHLPIIEDAAEALGAKYQKNIIGTDSDVACFSFNGNKIMTTGGGGMLVTNNTHKAEKARYLSTQAKDDAIEFIHHEIGFNYRMSNIHAAIGCAQLEQMPTYIQTKRQIAETYTRAFSQISGLCPHIEAPWAFHTYWLYTITVEEAGYGHHCRTLQQKLEDEGIQTRPLWQPMHLSPAHAQHQSYACQTATDLYKKALSLPCSIGLTKSDQNRVIETMHDFQN